MKKKPLPAASADHPVYTDTSARTKTMRYSRVPSPQDIAKAKENKSSK